jgi:hypothetical protein
VATAELKQVANLVSSTTTPSRKIFNAKFFSKINEIVPFGTTVVHKVERDLDF